MMESIEFKDVPGFPGYRVGTDGSVWGSGRTDRKPVLRRLKTFGAHGYCQVHLFSCGKRHMYYVHRLVMAAFVGECPKGMEVLHGDNDRANNNLKNLKYGTRKDNMDDQRRHGTLCRGARRWNAVLDDDKVREMRSMVGARPTKEIASIFGITPRGVRSVISRRNWNHIA